MTAPGGAFSAEIARPPRHADGRVLHCSGYVDGETEAGFGAAIAEALDGSVRWLVVDLGALTFMNSMGWGRLIMTGRLLRDRGGDVLLCGMGEAVAAGFELLAFDQIFRIFATPEDAVGEIERSRKGG